MSCRHRLTEKGKEWLAGQGDKTGTPEMREPLRERLTETVVHLELLLPAEGKVSAQMIE